MTDSGTSKGWRYGIAVLSVVIALAAHLGLDPILGPGEQLLVFTLSILVVARFGGRGPGFAATALSVLSAWFFLIDPRFSFRISEVRDVWNLVLLAAVGAGISLLSGRLRRASHPDLSGRGSPVTRSSLWRAAFLGTAFLLLGGMTRLLYSDFEREKDLQSWVTHTYQVLNQSRILLSAMQDAETGQRGYLLTADKRYLEPFQSASQAEPSAFQSLRRLTADNPRQQARLDAIERLLKAKFSIIQKTIALRDTAGLEPAVAVIRTHEGKRIMDELRANVLAFEEVERGLLAKRSEAARAQALRTHWVLGLGSASLMVLLLASGAIIERDIYNRERARQALRRSEERLHLALEAANAGAWEWDLQTNENVWSEELWKLYELEPHSCTPSHEAWRQVVHPDDRAKAERAAGEAARAGAKLNLEFRVRDHDGSARWLLARGQPWPDGTGKAARYAGIVLDITARKQAEEVLRESEQRLRRFAETAPVAIAMFDLEMRYIAASQRFRDDYNLGDQPLAGRSHYEIFPEVTERWREIHRHCLAGAVERHPGERFVRSGGAQQWVRWEMQPWRQANGEIGGVVLFSEDITGQELSEQALRESEEQFRTLANAIPQLCWMADADGWIFWYNQRWYEYTGATPEQMEGWGWQMVHDPDTLPKVLERWQGSVASGEPFDMVFPLRGADGTFHPFLTRVMPVRDHQGKVVRWFGTNTNITEQQRTEAELRHASEQRRIAMEAAALGAWEYRFEAGEVIWDEHSSRMFGGAGASHQMEYGEAIARIHPEDRPHIEEAVRQALVGVNGGAYHREFRVVWPDSTVHWIASHGLAQFEEGNGSRRPVRFTGVNMEITERKQAELEIRVLNAELERRVRERTAQLEAANKELEAFAYSVSHDLRAPLRGIDGWSLALAEDYASQIDERAQQYLDRVRSEAQRMGSLIDALLQLSRVTRTKMQVGPVDLSAIAHGIASRLIEANGGRRLEFVIEPGLAAAGDAKLLEIALTNLFANAVKFTGPRPEARIEIGCNQMDGNPVFFVRDNGVGFDPAFASRLFGAFQRLHKTKEFPGTGIGLATVQRVVRLHGGRIWAESNPGEGAVFYFTLRDAEWNTADADCASSPS